MNEINKIMNKKQILVSSLNDLPDNLVDETMLITQNILANDWLKPEEEEAWQNL